MSYETYHILNMPTGARPLMQNWSPKPEINGRGHCVTNGWEFVLFMMLCYTFAAHFYAVHCQCCVNLGQIVNFFFNLKKKSVFFAAILKRMGMEFWFLIIRNFAKLGPQKVQEAWTTPWHAHFPHLIHTKYCQGAKYSPKSRHNHMKSCGRYMILDLFTSINKIA